MKHLYDLFISELNLSSISQDEFRLYIYDLNSRAILRLSKDLTDFLGGGGHSTDERAPNIYITDIGRRFFIFISEN